MMVVQIGKQSKDSKRFIGIFVGTWMLGMRSTRHSFGSRLEVRKLRFPDQEKLSVVFRYWFRVGRASSVISQSVTN